MEETGSAGTEPLERTGRSHFVTDAFHSKKLNRAVLRSPGRPAHPVPYKVRSEQGGDNGQQGRSGAVGVGCSHPWIPPCSAEDQPSTAAQQLSPRHPPAEPGRESGEGHFSCKPRMTHRSGVLSFPHARNNPQPLPGRSKGNMGRGGGGESSPGAAGCSVLQDAAPGEVGAGKKSFMQPPLPAQHAAPGEGERAFPYNEPPPAPGMRPRVAERSPPVLRGPRMWPRAAERSPPVQWGCGPGMRRGALRCTGMRPEAFRCTGTGDAAPGGKETPSGAPGYGQEPSGAPGTRPRVTETSPPAHRAPPPRSPAGLRYPVPRPPPPRDAARTDPKEPAGGGAAQRGPRQGAEPAEQHLSPAQVRVLGPGPPRQLPAAVPAAPHGRRQAAVAPPQQLPVAGHGLGRRHGDQRCPPMARRCPPAPRRLRAGRDGDGTPLPAVTGDLRAAPHPPRARPGPLRAPLAPFGRYSPPQTPTGPGQRARRGAAAH